MKAITTKFHGPTNTRGSRYSAEDADKNRIVVHSQGRDSDKEHQAAAEALCQKMGWHGYLYGGWIKGGMAWVFADTYQFTA